MAITGNGTTTHITTTTAFSPGDLCTAYSWSFIYRNAAVPASATVDVVYSIIGGAGAFELDFIWDHTNSIYKNAWIHKQADSTVKTVQNGGFLANTDYVIGATWSASDNTFRAYLDGALFGSVTATAPTNSHDVKISALSFGGTNNFDDGTIAECAVWSGVALSAGEMLALGKRVAPSLIRPQSLLDYRPLIRNINEVTRSTGLTSTGTTAAAHPRIIYGEDDLDMTVVDTATYVISPSGGITMGGVSAYTAAYVLTPSGGITMGGNSQKGLGFSLSHGLAFQGEDPTINQGIAIAQNLRESDWYAEVTPSFNMRSKMRLRTPYLSTGLYRR